GPFVRECFRSSLPGRGATEHGVRKRNHKPLTPCVRLLTGGTCWRGFAGAHHGAACRFDPVRLLACAVGGDIVAFADADTSHMPASKGSVPIETFVASLRTAAAGRGVRNPRRARPPGA